MEIYKSDAGSAVLGYLADVCNNDSVRKMHLYGTGAVKGLEDKLKSHYSMKYALCVTNATTALMAIAIALDLKKEEFITTPYTYGATLSGWLFMGNRPVFADIETETLTLDCKSIKQRISRKIGAILASDIYGNPHDSIGLREIADEYGLWYISDSAQSLGAFRDDLPASSLADALVVSFTVGKTVFAGEGAGIVTNNHELYEKLVWLTQHPIRQRVELGLNLSNEFGLNARIHPLAAVWANAEFDSSMNKLKSYQEECFRLIEALNDIGLTERINFREDRIIPSFFKLSALWRNGKKAESALLKELKRYGFMVGIDKPPVQILYKQPAYITQYARNMHRKYNCPVAEEQSASRFCLEITDQESQ